MSQLLFTHKNYDPFHSYVRLIKYLFKIMLFFYTRTYFSYVFIKNLLRIKQIFFSNSALGGARAKHMFSHFDEDEKFVYVQFVLTFFRMCNRHF